MPMYYFLHTPVNKRFFPLFKPTSPVSLDSYLFINYNLLINIKNKYMNKHHLTYLKHQKALSRSKHLANLALVLLAILLLTIKF